MTMAMTISQMQESDIEECFQDLERVEDHFHRKIQNNENRLLTWFECKYMAIVAMRDDVKVKLEALA